MNTKHIGFDASTLAPRPQGDCADESAHLVQFFEADSFLVDAAARFLLAGLVEGDAAVVIATSSHREGLEDRLRAQGFDPVAAREQGRYVAFDAAETLSKLMVGSWPDETRFAEIVGGALGEAAAKGERRRLRVFGEMVALLCAEGKPAAAIRLEELWEGLRHQLTFSLLCGYPIGALQWEVDGQRFREICRAHSHVIPAESYTALGSPDTRLRAIADLQRKASVRGPEIAERKRAEQAQAELAAIVESSDDAIIGKSLEGIVTSWNRGAERIFGYTPEEMIGQPISRLMPPERRDDFSTILEAIRRGECVEHFETDRVRKDGTRIHVSLTVSPIRDSAGRVIGASKIARDVTARRQADAEREELLGVVERACAQAEEANRAKDEFLAMLGHELRNPLSAVRNAVVAARLDDSRRARALEIARRQTEQLARLVDDLLDVSRITQGRIPLRKERVYLAEVIERALETTRSLVEDRGHMLSVSLSSDDIHVDGDPTRLEQIIVNLLTNAAKYTDRGGRIEVRVERQGDQAVLRVRDSGVGIAPDLLSRVFDLFMQAGRELDRTQGGLGIGLTVVRRLVELHGGHVEAHSDGLGKGAEFVVRLPAVPVRAEKLPEAIPPARPTAAGAVPGRARVLLVEDNPDAAESLMMLLEVLGHHVRVVHDGITALEVALANVPDVMLVDVGLPGIDGYEVARRIRQHPDSRRVVLVALTGYSREEDRQRALRAGFDYHLVKPVDPNALEGLVNSLGKEKADPDEPSTLH